MNENELLLQTCVPILDMIPGGKLQFFVATIYIAFSTRQEWWKDKTTITVSFELGKRLSNDYDGPPIVMKFLSYFADSFDAQSSDPRQRYDWVLKSLSLREFGKDIGALQSQSEKENIFQYIYDHPNDDTANEWINTFFKVMNGIASIRIEPDQLVLHPRTRKFHIVGMIRNRISTFQRIWKKNFDETVRRYADCQKKPHAFQFT